jgi:transcriptional regulator with XRE-family HTH domain
LPVFSSHLIEYPALDLGCRLREERQRRGLTLGDLAERVQLSIARLSQVENGLVVPDFSLVLRISEALGLNADSLLPEERTFPYQVRRDSETRSTMPRRSSFVHISSGRLAQSHDFWPLADLFVGRHIEPLLGRIRFIPDSDLRLYYHDEVEFAFVLKGTMEFRIRTRDGEARELLSGGDCVMFRSDMPHVVRAASDEPAESIHVFSGPSAPTRTAWDWYSPHARGFVADASDEASAAVGLKLRVMREARGWSLEETARLAGLKERQLLQVEGGKRPVPLDALVALARAFGEPLRPFFGSLRANPPYYVLRRSAEIRRISARKRRSDGDRGASVAENVYYPLAADFPARYMFPCLIEVSAASNEVRLTGHHGEEFIYVLEGQLELTTYSEDKRVTETLRAGDSCFLDSSVPHMLRGQTKNPYSETGATVLDVFYCPLGESYLFED